MGRDGWGREGGFLIGVPLKLPALFRPPPPLPLPADLLKLKFPPPISPLLLASGGAGRERGGGRKIHRAGSGGLWWSFLPPDGSLRSGRRGEKFRKFSRGRETGGKFGVGGNKCDDVRSGNSIRGADCGLSFFSRPASSFPLNVVIVARL